jgi:hypothetical protein
VVERRPARSPSPCPLHAPVQKIVSSHGVTEPRGGVRQRRCVSVPPCENILRSPIRGHLRICGQGPRARTRPFSFLRARRGRVKKKAQPWSVASMTSTTEGAASRIMASMP